jgi:hypothetical protein
MTSEDMHRINQIVVKLNSLEDSKFGQSPEKRMELADRQLPLFRQLHAVVGEIICPF